MAATVSQPPHSPGNAAATALLGQTTRDLHADLARPLPTTSWLLDGLTPGQRGGGRPVPVAEELAGRGAAALRGAVRLRQVAAELQPRAGR
jgi:hypothetical protein